jgi:leucyl-tRNA synthetase
MDTFVDSAWYYMRYACPDAKGGMVDARNDYWMPMDQYIGGIEHAVLHLLYARFWTKAMRDIGLVKFDEPFTKLFTQGMLLNESFYREDASGKKRWYYPSEVNVKHDERGTPVGATAKEDGLPLMLGGIEKMSKSKNNVVEPREFIGSSAPTPHACSRCSPARPTRARPGPTREPRGFPLPATAMVFRGQAGACGAQRRRGLLGEGDAKGAKALRREVHLLLKQIRHDYDRLQYNTVASGAMKLLNALDEFHNDGSAASNAALREGLSVLLRTLYPVCPHIAHVLWNELGFARQAGRPDRRALAAGRRQRLLQDEIELVLQVAGKTRGAIRVPAGADRPGSKPLALAAPEFAKFGEGKPARKVVIVPGRLVNVVV